MIPSIDIRGYKEEDFGQVCHLNASILEASDAHLHQFLGWDKELQDIVSGCLQQRGVFLVGELQASAQRQIIAMGILRPIDGQRGEIRGMRVHPEHQRQGLGRLILTRLEETARELGYRLLQLDTTVLQQRAIWLYTKSGYVEIRRDTSSGIEEIFFEKELAENVTSTSDTAGSCF